MRRRFVFILVGMISLMAISGCLQAPTQGKPGGDAPAVISVWYTLEGKSEEELLKQFKRINTEHPEVLVKGEKIPEAKIVDTIWNLQAGGEGPEIIIASRPTLFSLYEKGTISPLLADIDLTYPGAKAVFTFNQQPFAGPWLADIPMLYYRKDKVTVPPISINEILEKKNAIATRSVDTALLSPWWQAEGGSLIADGTPTIDSPANSAFLGKLRYLRSEGLLITEGDALGKFSRGEVNYLISWVSDKSALERSGIDLGCLALCPLLGSNGKVLLDRTIGIANTSIKTVPALEQSIRLVEQELLKVETQQDMSKAKGNIPLNRSYYEEAKSGSFEAQVGLTLGNALSMEGYYLDWKLLGIQNKSWNTIIKGAKLEEELAKGQQSALEIVKSK